MRMLTPIGSIQEAMVAQTVLFAPFIPHETPCVGSTNGHDLPVHLLIGQASESDFTLQIKSLDLFNTWS